jgi:D-cysteine desulfhydrase
MTRPSRPPRIPLVHAPTPLHRFESLGRELGIDLWVKRDDMTGGADSGNKLRKLEFLLADAKRKRATIVLTCGGTQSNHARATAIASARLGMKSVLLLRRGDLPDSAHPAGNILLDRLVGAEIRFMDRSDWPRRNELLAAAARELEGWGEKPYVVPEGGSNGLGALGYVEAMRETRTQMDLGLGPRAFDVVVHACGSGGTAAGVALGAAQHRIAPAVRPIAVCDDARTFQAIIERVMAEAQALDDALVTTADLTVDDAAKGPAYGVMDADQLAFLVHVARQSGLVLDPTYTGKAMAGLKAACARGDVARGACVLFLHTGGLPGLLAQGAALEGALGTAPS